MNRRNLAMSLARIAGAAVLTAAVGMPAAAFAADLSPTDMVQQVSDDVLGAIKADKAMMAGDVNKIMALVDSKVMPNINFNRMAGAAVGPAWRTATPEQKKQVQQQFKLLLVRTYAGAFKLASDKTAKVLPLRGDATAKDVLVQTQLLGSGEPIKLDYRLEKTPGQGLGWRAYNLNVGGIWMIDSYKQQFASVIASKGIPGLIDTLEAKNKANAAAAAAK